MKLQDLIPEWPTIDPIRPCVLGLKSGIDHPLAAVVLVVTPLGIVAVREYRERLRALAAHLQALRRMVGDLQPTWAAPDNEPEVRIEFAQHGIGVCPVDSSDLTGIQRVQSWLFAQQLFFAPTVPLLIADMQAYRFADNELASGEKRQQERAFHQADELPTALRIALLSWPQLPALPTAETTRNLRQLVADGLMSDRTRADIERLAEYERADAERETVSLKDRAYPFAEMFDASDNEGHDSMF